MPRSTKKKEKLPKEIEYDTVIIALFKALRSGSADSDQMDFLKKDIEQTIERLVKKGALDDRISNVPDIKYTFDARRDFPTAIKNTGHWAIVGRGKGRYRFVRMPHSNLIRIPLDLAHLEKHEQIDNTPPIVLGVMGDDEQATMARVRHNQVIAHFTGLTNVHQVQGHERTAVDSGQVEIDEVYVGEDGKGNRYVVPLSAKGGKDMLSYTQALNLNLYVAGNSVARHENRRRQRYHGLERKPLGAVRTSNDTVVLVEFSTETDVREIQIKRAREYRFKSR